MRVQEHKEGSHDHSHDHDRRQCLSKSANAAHAWEMACWERLDLVQAEGQFSLGTTHVACEVTREAVPYTFQRVLFLFCLWCVDLLQLLDDARVWGRRLLGRSLSEMLKLLKLCINLVSNEVIIFLCHRWCSFPLPSLLCVEST